MLDETDAEAIYCYEIVDRPGVRLWVGIPKGQQRPAIWISQGSVSAMTGAVNRVIEHYKKLNGDQNDQPY